MKGEKPFLGRFVRAYRLPQPRLLLTASRLPGALTRHSLFFAQKSNAPLPSSGQELQGLKGFPRFPFQSSQRDDIDPDYCRKSRSVEA
jgi:hypothetical protein